MDEKQDLPEPRKVEFNEPGPDIPDAVTRSAIVHNDEGQTFRISAAARGNVEEFDRFCDELRVYLRALAVDPIPLEQALDEAAKTADAGATAIAIDAELIDAPDLERGRVVEIAMRFDPRLRRGSADCWVGPGRFRIDVADGAVDLDRGGGLSNVSVNASAAARELQAGGRVVVTGTGDWPNRYSGDTDFYRIW